MNTKSELKKVCNWNHCLILLLLTLLLTVSNSSSAEEDALKKAIESENIANAKVILESKIYTEKQQAEYLLAATSKRSLPLLELLIKHGFNPDAVMDDGFDATAFMYAAYVDRPDMLDVLNNAGVDINRRDKIGDSAMNWAVYGGKRKSVEWLIKHKARIDLVGHGNALQIAKRRGFTDIVLMLCKVQNCSTGMSPLSKKFAQLLDSGNVNEAIAMIKNGFKLSTIDETGRPFFHRAARLGRLDVVRAIFEHEATNTSNKMNIDIKDDIGFTALMESAREQHIAMVKLLLNNGANAGIKANESALNIAAIHLAAIGGNKEIIRVIVDQKINIDAVDTDNSTAAMWAFYSEKPEVAKYLIELGADPKIKNNFGSSVEDMLK